MAMYTNQNLASTSRLQGLGQQTGQAGQAGQDDALELMRRQATGGGTSVAQAQLQNQAAADANRAMSMAASGRGGNLAGMQQTALGQAAGAQQQTNRDMATLRAQEQLGAQQAYAGQANTMAGQQMSYEQMAAQNSQVGAQQGMDWNLGDRAAKLASDQFKFQKGKGIADSIIGGVGAIGGLIPGSDVRLKEDIRPASVADAVAQLPGFSYDYKQGSGEPEGQQMGVMAQDVAKTPLAATLLRERPDGMMGIDGGRAGIASLAASGENARRIAQLEDELRRLGGGRR